MADPLLHHEFVTTPGETARAWLYILPGIYGMGRNWATVARRLIAERPDTGVVLVDLRQHGASQGFAPPHTLKNAAQDVIRLAHAIDRPPTAVLGHSFGGKVALELARHSPPTLAQVWIIDSTPDAGDPRGSAWAVLQLLRSLPGPFASRDDAIRQLIEGGTDPAVAQWLSTNLERTDGSLRWRFELSAMEALLLDFFRTSSWDVVEAPPENVQMHFVKAAESSVLTANAQQRIQRANAQVHLHTLEGGHWLNADNPEGVVALLRAQLPNVSAGQSAEARL